MRCRTPFWNNEILYGTNSNFASRQGKSTSGNGFICNRIQPDKIEKRRTCVHTARKISKMELRFWLFYFFIVFVLKKQALLSYFLSQNFYIYNLMISYNMAKNKFKIKFSHSLFWGGLGERLKIIVQTKKTPTE